MSGDTEKFLMTVVGLARGTIGAGACPCCVARALAHLGAVIAEDDAGIPPDEFLAAVAAGVMGDRALNQGRAVH
jgi:hypothetical protein